MTLAEESAGAEDASGAGAAGRRGDGADGSSESATLGSRFCGQNRIPESEFQSDQPTVSKAVIHHNHAAVCL